MFQKVNQIMQLTVWFSVTIVYRENDNFSNLYYTGITVTSTGLLLYLGFLCQTSHTTINRNQAYATAIR